MATKIPFTGKFKETCEYGRKGKLWKSGMHGGTDLVGITSEKVYSICNGTVERAGYDNGGFGNYVRIKEDGTENRIYLAHLSKIYVRVGQKVGYTTVVGQMGSTGNSTGKHTHVEIRQFSGGKATKKLNASVYMGIPNKVGEYNSENYQIGAPNPNNNNFVGTKTFAIKTNIRETPSLKGIAHLYKPETIVKILEENVANVDGYIWDKVFCPATNRTGYVARTENRYK